MPISFKKETIFIHVPKNAGTSVMLAKDYDFRDLGHHTFLYYKSAYPDEWEKFNKYAIVRNPYDRAVSSYEYSRKINSYWHNDHARINMHPDYEITSNLTFGETLELLPKNVLRHQGWIPQHLYLVSGNEKIIFHKGYLETEENNIKIFFYEDLAFNEIFTNLFPGLDSINKSDRESDFLDYYTDPKLMAIIQSVYKEDFEKFKYQL